MPPEHAPPSSSIANSNTAGENQQNNLHELAAIGTLQQTLA
jgi:hypothetical protein